jgi:serine/threonine protein kinase
MNASQALHPTDQILQAYGLGKLDDASAESVNAHLEGCPDCRQRVAALSSDSFLVRLRDAKARPESLHPAVSSTDGLSILGAAPGAAALPPVGSLPPGLADHSDYQVLRELGQGGMGVVYLAQNQLMGRLEVLKVVSEQLIKRRGVADRFLGEIRNAARLHHPNVVTAYAALRLGESIALAMEHVEGLDLARLVKAKGPLPVANACNYIHQAALGLQHAHEAGMVHRDIKPSNLMLTGQSNRALIKVLDFGLAKVKSEGAVDGGLTNEGQMLGTPHYIAPEQTLDARKADIRADIYSLGCTLYYLLTGEPPFEGTSLYDILQAHHSREALPLNLARPEVPVEVAAIVAKMMAKEPGRRFQEPKEVAQALKPFFKSGNVASVGEKPDVSRALPPEPKRETAGAGPVPRRTAAGPEPATASPGGKAGQQPRSEPMWDSLVDLKEIESSSAAAPAAAPSRRPPWLWPLAAVVVLLLGFIAAWGTGVIKIGTPEGFIVIEDLPAQATVIVDGKRATVHWPDGGEPAEITVAPGDHMIQVEKDGFKMTSKTVRVERNGRTMLTVRLVPLEAPRQEKDTADNLPSTSQRKEQPMPPAGGDVATSSPKRQPVEAEREAVPETADTARASTSRRQSATEDAASPHTAPSMDLNDRNRRAVDTVLSLGGQVTIRLNDQFLILKPGQDTPKEAFELMVVYLIETRVTDGSLDVFQDLPHLSDLNLNDALNVTDEGVAHLGKLWRLDHLGLRKTEVTDNGLAHLAHLPTIKRLNLQNTRVSDSGLALLSSLRQLEHLWLSGTKVTDNGLAHLKDVSTLISLGLENTAISGAGLVHLKGLPKLTGLELSLSGVTDEGLEHLRGLKHLRQLGLRETSVSDSGLALRWTPEAGQLGMLY